MIDNRTVPSWSSELIDYRSPGLFHEFILSGNKSFFGRRLHGVLNDFFGLLVSWMDLVGRENFLVIKNEDMVPTEVTRQGGLLDQVSTFLGIDRDSFDPTIFESRTNCNDGNMTSRGENRKCMADTINKGSSSITYPISGNRTMLSKTRNLIYVLASDGCEMMTEYFNHVIYEGCINRGIQRKK